jgi:hypothetical protein
MAASPKLNLSPSFVSAPPRDRWRSLREVLGGLVILAVWISLWSWVAIGVLPSGQHRSTGPTPASVEQIRA